MEEGKKPVSYQIGSKGSKGYSISGPGYQAQGQQSGNGQQYVIAGQAFYAVSGPGFQSQGQSSNGRPYTIMTSNIPEGYRVVTDKDNKPLFVAQKTGPMQQLQGVVRNRTLLQGQQLPGMGQMQGTGPSGTQMQGQQMGSMMQMQG
jgi:hypothetical protein